MGAYRIEAPLALLLLLVLPALLWWLARPRPTNAMRIPNLSVLATSTPTWRVRMSPKLVLLRIAPFALMIVALARPQVGEANAVVENRGIDIVVVQDLSGSMGEPFGPQTGSGPHDTRLSASKRLDAQFVKARKDDRLGLVVFESQPLTLSPLTDDHDALAKIIDGIQNGQANLPDGTAIGAGLASGINVLRGSSARSRVIILLTDGEENIHQVEPDEAAKLAKSLGIRVYTIGIIDPRTNEVDVNALKAIAEPTGGAFFPATSPQALGQVYDRIDKLEKSKVQQTHFYRYDELAPWLLVPAFGLLLLEGTLASTVLRRTPE